MGERAVARVVTALSRALADPQGRWVLGPQAEARSELRLTLRASAVLEHVRLDRTFVADGRRWIVDFKTSEHEGGSLREFADSEVARYAPQLEDMRALADAHQQRVLRTREADTR